MNSNDVAREGPGDYLGSQADAGNLQSSQSAVNQTNPFHISPVLVTRDTRSYDSFHPE